MTKTKKKKKNLEDLREISLVGSLKHIKKYTKF